MEIEEWQKPLLYKCGMEQIKPDMWRFIFCENKTMSENLDYISKLFDLRYVDWVKNTVIAVLRPIP